MAASLVVGKQEETTAVAFAVASAVAFAVAVKVALRAVGEEACGAVFWVASLVVAVQGETEAAVLVVEPWVDSSEVQMAGS